GLMVRCSTSLKAALEPSLPVAQKCSTKLGVVVPLVLSIETWTCSRPVNVGCVGSSGTKVASSARIQPRNSVVPLGRVVVWTKPRKGGLDGASAPVAVVG